MIVRRTRRWALSESEVTPKAVWRDRRRFLQGMAVSGAALAVPALGIRPAKADLNYKERAIVVDGEDVTSRDAITSYNNYYEFGTDKSDPATNAWSLKTDPWSIRIEGEVARPTTLAIEDILSRYPLEERIYRLRCVEAWSMVIPWVGFPLADLIRDVEPTSRAKYVQFETLLDREMMPGTRRRVLDWPYVEGLRIDEAVNPLTMLAVGLYGDVLPNQNGAPIRLVVPWKYGFKSIKSIVAIRFVENQPETSWSKATPQEYGFYSNVNPNVNHPRWSQATERRIGEFRRRDTLVFNGYADEVAHLYAGMDLQKYF